MYASSDGISHLVKGEDDTFYLVEGEVRKFNCSVPSINPGASFSWLIDGRGLPEMTYSSQDDVGMDGLTTSTSEMLFTATWSHHDKLLKCQASNSEGHPGISISVRLYVYGKRGLTALDSIILKIIVSEQTYLVSSNGEHGSL